MLEETGRGTVFTLVTENVDGLHHAAGSRRIHDLPGNIRATPLAP